MVRRRDFLFSRPKTNLFLLFLERASVSSAEAGDADDNELENEPVRLSRPTKKVEINLSDRHSQTSQQRQLPNNASILSDASRVPAARSNQTESNAHLKIVKTND